MRKSNTTGYIAALLTAIYAVGLVADIASAQEKKPNIVVIWGDDIGVHNISAYNHGDHGLSGRPILTGSPRKVPSSPISTLNRVARLDARRSFWASIRSGPGC